MKRQFSEFLNDILTEIDVIKEATDNIDFEEFQKNKKTQQHLPQQEDWKENKNN